MDRKLISIVLFLSFFVFFFIACEKTATSSDDNEIQTENDEFESDLENDADLKTDSDEINEVENKNDELIETDIVEPNIDEIVEIDDDFENNNPDQDIDENNDDSDMVPNDTCPDSNKFCHVHKNINWSDVSTGKRWNVAVKYCDDIKGRLPTISEFRTLIQNCPATETGGECKVTDECLSYSDCWTDQCNGCANFGEYSVFGHTDNFWSSSERSDETVSVWVIDFQYGSIYNYYTDTTKPFSVICVEK